MNDQFTFKIQIGEKIGDERLERHLSSSRKRLSEERDRVYKDNEPRDADSTLLASALKDWMVKTSSVVSEKDDAVVAADVRVAVSVAVVVVSVVVNDCLRLNPRHE